MKLSAKIILSQIDELQENKDIRITFAGAKTVVVHSGDDQYIGKTLSDAVEKMMKA